ncbi:MAG: hypothetical protein HC838_06045 [Spirulinaceae cyanobacterium RM2_2_10]|nr:hypothetical protein [Spirulinaceae cyanobacterium RM2_2_10]
MLYLYKLTERESWLTRAEAGVRYLLMTARPQSDFEDYWLLRSLSELFRHVRNPRYHQQAEQIATVIANHQHPGRPQADWLGSFGKPPSAIATAARLEGLCAVYHLVNVANVAVNRQAHERRHDIIWLAGRFLLQLQCEPETVMYLPKPARARDGFRQQLTDFTIRLDDVYRSITGLLAVYRLTGEPTSQVIRYN